MVRQRTATSTTSGFPTARTARWKRRATPACTRWSPSGATGRRRSRRSRWRRGSTTSTPRSGCTRTTRRTASTRSSISSTRRAIVAVGEAGLDYYYDHSPRDAQHTAFAAQIQLAHERRLPLVIHTRDAWDDTFDILRAEGTPERTIFHCFTGGPDEARRCLDLGATLSFSGIVTFKGAPEVQAAALALPARPDADRDRQPVSRPTAPPRQTEPSGLGRPRRPVHRRPPRRPGADDRRRHHRERPPAVRL